MWKSVVRIVVMAAILALVISAFLGLAGMMVR